MDKFACDAAGRAANKHVASMQFRKDLLIASVPQKNSSLNPAYI